VVALRDDDVILFVCSFVCSFVRLRQRVLMAAGAYRVGYSGSTDLFYTYNLLGQ